MPRSHDTASRNRQNALASTAPRTDGGKALARRNAVRHGLTANPAAGVVEHPGRFSALLRQVDKALLPDEATLNRLVRYETHAERSLIRCLETMAKLRGATVETLSASLRGGTQDGTAVEIRGERTNWKPGKRLLAGGDTANRFPTSPLQVEVLGRTSSASRIRRPVRYTHASRTRFRWPCSDRALHASSGARTSSGAITSGGTACAGHGVG